MPQKIQYLEGSLSEDILKNIKHYPATIEGYKAKLKYLHEKFGNKNEIREELRRKFTALQPTTKRVPDIQVCFNQALLYVNLLKLYYGTDVKLDHLRTVFCAKFPPSYYESRLDPTDETLDHLIWCIEQTLKVKNISYTAHKPLHSNNPSTPQNQNRNSPQNNSHTTHQNFYTQNTTPTRGRGRGRGRGNNKNNFERNNPHSNTSK